MWRPRDHERFVGGYDPEHEMPDPDRGPRGRFQSDVYRHNARDSRFPYRWNPDRFEDRFRDRPPSNDELRWNRDARDREFYDRGYYDRAYGYDHGYDSDRGYDRDDFGRWGSDYDRAREFGGRGYERDWRDRQRFDQRDYDDSYENRWRNRRS